MLGLLLVASILAALVLFSVLYHSTVRVSKMHVYGLHDSGGEHLFREVGVNGWTVYAEAVGDDPNDLGGKAFSTESEAICRLSFGWYGAGNIPDQTRHDRFAQRCANFVRASHNCRIWIIGNEPNLADERPKLPDNSLEVITPQRFASCFKRCRAAIKAVQAYAIVIPGAIAPWNNQTSYSGNEAGDWVNYYADLLAEIGPEGLDGIALHAYARANKTENVYSDSRMGAPFDKYRSDFRAFEDFLNVTPTAFRHLPVYITEFDANDEVWGNDSGMISAAFGHIAYWNQQASNQKIMCMALYRWGAFDRWQLSDKAGSIEDFKRAMQARAETPTPLAKQSFGAGIGASIGTTIQQASELTSGDAVTTCTTVNMRSEPGVTSSVVMTLNEGLNGKITGEKREALGLIWWPVSFGPQSGWVAEFSPGGERLIKKTVRRGIRIHRPCIGPITQLFGENPDYYSKIPGYEVPLKGHNGVDYGIAIGTDIYAADGGTVYDIRNEDGGFGLHMLIDHGWGFTLYAHLSLCSVAKGQPVGKGQVIAWSGNSGRGSGPHLHFGLKINPVNRADGWGGYSDPMQFIEE